MLCSSDRMFLYILRLGRTAVIVIFYADGRIGYFLPQLFFLSFSLYNFVLLNYFNWFQNFFLLTFPPPFFSRVRFTGIGTFFSLSLVDFHHFERFHLVVRCAASVSPLQAVSTIRKSTGKKNIPSRSACVIVILVIFVVVLSCILSFDLNDMMLSEK